VPFRDADPGGVPHKCNTEYEHRAAGEVPEIL